MQAALIRAVVTFVVGFVLNRILKIDRRKLKRSNYIDAEGNLVQRAPRIMLYTGLVLAIAPPLWVGTSMYFSDSFSHMEPGFERLFGVYFGVWMIGVPLALPGIFLLVRYCNFHVIDAPTFVERRTTFGRTRIAHGELTDFEVGDMTYGGSLKLVSGRTKWVDTGLWRRTLMPVPESALAQKRRKVLLPLGNYAVENIASYLLIKTAVVGNFGSFSAVFNALGHPHFGLSGLTMRTALALHALKHPLEFKKSAEEYAALGIDRDPQQIYASAEPEFLAVVARVEQEHNVSPVR